MFVFPSYLAVMGAASLACCIAVPPVDLTGEGFLVGAVPGLDLLEEVESSGSHLLELRTTTTTAAPVTTLITDAVQLEARLTTTAPATSTTVRSTGRTVTTPVWTSRYTSSRPTTVTASTAASGTNCVFR